MKVNDIINKSSKAIDMINKETGGKRDSVSARFSSELDRMEGLTARERLNLLLDKIDKQSERLSKNTDIREVIAYKKLISQFLKESTEGMVKFSKDSFLDRRGRHRIYGIIKKVNEELEELTKDVLKKEKDNIKILKRLDDIRGLILDIYM